MFRYVGLQMFFLAILTVGCVRSEGKKSLTVCEVLANIDDYQGKQISVTGVFNWTTHGWTLSNNSDFRPCPSVQKKGRTWPGGIYLNVIETESQRIAAMLSEFNRTVREHNRSGIDRLSILATFTGELSFNEGAKIYRRPDKAYAGSGYGLNGQFPAFLLVKDVRDIKLVPRAMQ
jgi:hypothetical protein